MRGCCLACVRVPPPPFDPDCLHTLTASVYAASLAGQANFSYLHSLNLEELEALARSTEATLAR